MTQYTAYMGVLYSRMNATGGVHRSVCMNVLLATAVRNGVVVHSPWNPSIEHVARLSGCLVGCLAATAVQEDQNDHWVARATFCHFCADRVAELHAHPPIYPYQ